MRNPSLKGSPVVTRVPSTWLNMPVHVVWNDAWITIEELSTQAISSLKPEVMHSVGILARYDSECVAISLDMAPDGRVRTLQYIPRSMLVSIGLLRDANII